jgi:hypothetical protein
MKRKTRQIDGKLETSIAPKRTLDQILGDTGTMKYKTMDIVVYEKNLSEMNKADLQRHAASLGVMPVDDRNILTGRLVKEFRRHVASYQPVTQPEQTKVSKKVLDILSGGR